MKDHAAHLWLLEQLDGHRWQPLSKKVPWEPVSMNDMRSRLNEGLDLNPEGAYSFNRAME